MSGRTRKARFIWRQASKVARVAAFGWLMATFSPAQGQSILDTRHNLSVSGPGNVRALDEQRVCIFCHTPHGARDAAPLWNRNDPVISYMPYDSPTLNAQVGQPTGASKLCLSCHDGTIAMGDLVSESSIIAFSTGDTMPPGPGLIGSDLRDDHPVSFDYFAALSQSDSLTNPASWPQELRLDATGQLQCTTCHDPHDDQFGNFLVMNNVNAQLCTQCHQVNGFNQTQHALSSAQWNGSGLDPWPHTEYTTVAANACMNCHVSHHSGTGPELLTYAAEENNCFSCHDGSVAPYDLESVFEKFAIHPVAATQGEHQAGESPLDAVGHVECVDCHNPHMARSAPAQPPNIMGAMQGVSGIDANGLPVDEAIYEYQVCFKCHSNENVPPSQTITRVITTYDLTKEFNPSSVSFHPVEVPGRGMDVPSLIAPLTTASVIYCTDCHNNDDVATPGAAGPHGSNNEFMLVRNYRIDPDTQESPTAYALCYGCHSRMSILNDVSFRYHQLHVEEEGVSCAICHDPHGIAVGQGNTTNNAHLINFDATLVTPDTVTGRLEYRSTGLRMGECYLTCHGVSHSPLIY